MRAAARRSSRNARASWRSQMQRAVGTQAAFSARLARRFSRHWFGSSVSRGRAGAAASCPAQSARRFSRLWPGASVPRAGNARRSGSSVLSVSGAASRMGPSCGPRRANVHARVQQPNPPFERTPFRTPARGGLAHVPPRAGVLQGAAQLDVRLSSYSRIVVRAARIGSGLATPTFRCRSAFRLRGASCRCFSARVGARNGVAARRGFWRASLRKAGSCSSRLGVVPGLALLASGSELTSRARSLVAFSLAQAGRCAREQKFGRRVGDQPGTQGIAARLPQRFSRLQVGASVARGRVGPALGFARVVGLRRRKQNECLLQSSGRLRPCLRSAA
jgi:hypothetical protein